MVGRDVVDHIICCCQHGGDGRVVWGVKSISYAVVIGDGRVVWGVKSISYDVVINTEEVVGWCGGEHII